LSGTLRAVIQGLLQSGSQAEIAAELLKLICKAFWSATYMGIPDMLLQQDQFIGWMTCIHTLMDMPVPKVHHWPLQSPCGRVLWIDGCRIIMIQLASLMLSFKIYLQSWQSWQHS